jgi:hypothetical protein
MNKKLVGIFVSLTLMLGWANAQKLTMGEGVRSISLTGDLNTTSYSGTNLDLKGGYGVFVKPLVELGGLFEFQDNDFITRIGLRGYVEYNFDGGVSYLVPMVGGVIGLGYLENFSGDEVGFEFGVYAGAKYFLRDNLALVTTLGLGGSSGDTYDDKKDTASSTKLSFDIGLRWYY